ncbi:hypothetical protein MO867_13040 [Microbulbifer sp. OS29]|uniref:Uncharacterized protein n=1 Tax=Microbulbifer okhotskensis TaxID=2926617 RepID=A0A9X2EP71_9GAMM|nr:hypothetical protein [Microbulbifer okhotskensis]MCO1335259.1 hypothetical protein [Microbulbifer okhotskensis]
MAALIPSSGSRFEDMPSAVSLPLKVYVDLRKYNQRLLCPGGACALIEAPALI